MRFPNGRVPHPIWRTHYAHSKSDIRKWQHIDYSGKWNKTTNPSILRNWLNRWF